MKKLFFLVMFVMFFVSFLYPQTAANYQKQLQVAKDGFKWYKLKENTLSGAAGENGEMIIPPVFISVIYSSGFFNAICKDGNECIFSVNGDVVIPESRGYSSILVYRPVSGAYSSGYYFLVSKGVGNEKVYGVCNAKGEEILPLSEGYRKIDLDNYGNTYWFHVVKDGKCGIVDLNGNEVVAPNETYRYIDVVNGRIVYSNKKQSLVYRKGSSYKEESKDEVLLNIPVSQLALAEEDNFFGRGASAPVSSSVPLLAALQKRNTSSIKVFENAQDFLSFYNRSEKYPLHLGEKYNKALKYIKAGENDKAEKVFVSMLKIKDGYVESGSNVHAVYQLYHYYRYGFYDKYYNGTASYMDRTPMVYTIKGKKGLKQDNLVRSLSDENRLLLSVSEMLAPRTKSVNDSWAIRRAYDDIIYKKQNFAKGNYVFRAETLNSSKIVSKDIVAISLLKVLYDNGCINKLNMYDILKAYSYSSWQTNQVDEHGGRYAFELAEECLEFLPYISLFEQHKNVYDIGKNANELYREAKRVKESNQQKYIYLLSRAALFGNTDALKDIYTALEGSYMDAFGKDIFASSIARSKKLAYLKEYTDQYASYYKKLYDKKEEEAKAARDAEWRRKQAKKEQRREMWRNVGLAVLQVVAETGAQMQQAMAANSYGTGYTGGGYVGSYMSSIAPNQNLNHLIDPSFAMAQVQQKDYAEYMAVRENYQRMGKDLTYHEYQVLQGAAIMQMKEEGYDILEQMRKQSEENDEFEEKWRQKEKEAMKEKYDILLNRGSSSASSSSSSSTGSSSGSLYSSSSYSSSSSGSAKSGSSYSSGSSSGSTSSDTYSSSANGNLDSKQQFHEGKVSSDDYEYVKKVTLYIRTNNSNNVMFSGKDLCKKGANYYVKLDNTYYKVVNQNHYGFNSLITYGGKALYFNK